MVKVCSKDGNCSRQMQIIFSFFEVLSLQGTVCCVGTLDSGWVSENQKAKYFLTVPERETFRGHIVCVPHICTNYRIQNTVKKLQFAWRFTVIIYSSYVKHICETITFKLLIYPKWILFTCVQTERLTQARALLNIH